MVGLIGSQIVGGQQAGKGRLQPRAFEVEGIHVIDAAARGGLRFAAGADGDAFATSVPRTPSGSDSTSRASYSVSGVEVENAAGEHVGCDIAIEVLAVAVARQATDHGFILQPE